ncbi:MAG: PAS domain S-box protein [Bacillota bacterium]
MVINRDISERKRAEEALARSRAFYSSLIENSADIILILDAAGAVRYASPSVKKLHGYDPEYLAGRPILDFIHPDDVASAAATLAETLADPDNVRRLEVRVRHRDGSWRFVETTGRNLLDDPSVEGIIINARDVTERKKAETVNRATASLLRLFAGKTGRREYLQSAADLISGLTGCHCVGIRLLDEEGNISYEAAVGLSEDFLARERWISTKGDQCLCTRLITGKLEAGRSPAVTPGGTVYCNDLPAFVDGLPEEDRAGYRGVCRKHGFKSAALVPVRHGGTAVGAVHLLDERENMVTPEIVEMVETLAPLVGEIVHRFRVEEDLRLNSSAQAVINSILSYSLEDPEMEQLAARALDLLISLPWIALEKKGAVFLVEDDPGVLVLKAWRGLDGPALSECRRVAFGRCLCGLAAAEAKTQFADRIDHRHAIRYEGMAPHGHYCVPIISAGRVSGVINLYVQEGCRRDKRAEQLIEYVAGVLAGVIRHRRAEKALRESERHFRSVIENSSDIIAILDGKGVIRYLSPSVERVFGYRLEDLAGANVTGYIHPDEVEKVLGELADINEKPGDIRRGEVSLKHRDGSWRVLEYAAMNLIHDPAVSGLVINARDITERKRMDKDVQRAAKLESLGVLAGGIAHDFNNILMGVGLHLYLARSHLQPGSMAHEILAEAEEALMQAKGLTQQLLTFARGGAPILKTATVGGLIREVTAFALRGTAVRGEFSIPEDLWSVDLDEGQFSQVVQNIAINAVQAMPGGGLFEVSAQNVTVGEKDVFNLGAEKYVRISFRDHGTGIAPENMGRIFDPYFTTKQKGSGLGLTASYSVIKKHGGHISVESEEGAGTTFHIYLPAAQKAPVPETKKENPLLRGSGRILVMDDDEKIRSSLGGVLAGFGYWAEFARDGAEAVEIYRRDLEAGQPFAAVIMDLTVPGGMGGKEAIRELLKLDPGVRAIVSSGYSNDPVMAEYERHGFKGVIAKPYDVGDLNRLLYRIINEEEG